MSGTREYRFRIKGYTRATLPMERFVEYARDLVALFGHEASVHFDRIADGSAVLVANVDPSAAEGVRERLAGVRTGQAPSDAAQAFETLNKRLARDRKSAVLKEAGSPKVILFPGTGDSEPLPYGAIKQQSSVDGTLVRLGGRQELANIQIEGRDGKLVRCRATRDMARRICKHLYGPELRVYGEGRWCRGDDGSWEIGRLTISNFEVLVDDAIASVVASLRAVEGSDWDEVEDPLTELVHIRRGTDQTD